ncbi:MAG: phosphoribosylformylglycinamidine cyclo-ligase [Candidatus Hydrogenedentota bacterium]|nr:MAG: phosphoribosylformylglycinamidine cyclo-ligase [Candidatus Hydrogenedentota bacterium]
MNYKDAGVDTEKAASFIRNLKPAIEKTFQAVKDGKPTTSIGGFASAFEFPNSDYEVLSATDGVGTKIELYRQLQNFNGIGYDLVAMCANDLLCAGGTPAFFLDYIACGRLEESWYFPVMQDIAKACEEANMALIGGETAEHPGLMPSGHFDLAGFCVGRRFKKNALPKISQIKAEDVLIGIPSSGLHSNGFSLIRKLLKEGFLQSFTEKDIQDKILIPTRLYTRLTGILGEDWLLAMAHITGGGIFENLPRVLPSGMGAVIEKSLYKSGDIFSILQEHLKQKDLYSTFNMGTGFVIIAKQENADLALNRVQEYYADAEIIGYVTSQHGVFISDSRRNAENR